MIEVLVKGLFIHSKARHLSQGKHRKSDKTKLELGLIKHGQNVNFICLKHLLYKLMSLVQFFTVFKTSKTQPSIIKDFVELGGGVDDALV